MLISFTICIFKCCLQLAGSLVGVQNLTLEENREMQIAATATNSRIVDGVEQQYPEGTDK